MAKTRKNKVFSEQIIRSRLTTGNYDTYLDKTVYFGEDPFKLPADDNWDPSTGNCGIHALFTIDSLAKVTDKIKRYEGFKLVTENNIEHLLSTLDAGRLIEFQHTYGNRSLVDSLPRNNVYDTHDFVFVKGGSRYFLSQGFQYAYKHSLTSYTREQVNTMLHNILEHLCDPGNTKRWKDLDLSYYNKYFKADLLVGKLDQLNVDPRKKVNGIILEYLII